MHFETLARSRSALATSKAFDEEMEMGSFTYNGFSDDAYCFFFFRAGVGLYNAYGGSIFEIFC